MHKQSFTSNQWYILLEMIKIIAESGDYDDYYNGMIKDLVDFPNMQIGYMIIIDGDRDEHNVHTYLCRIIDQ